MRPSRHREGDNLPDMRRLVCSVAGLLLVGGCQTGGLSAANDLGTPRLYERTPEYDRIKSLSFYLPMSDGVELAVDLHLPRRLGSGQRVPTIIHQTRYWRSIDIRTPFDLFVDGRFQLWGSYRRYFVTRGYAWVDIDVRGTGASFGTWEHSYWHREVRDGAEILDWIIAQPWSNGKVGAWGVSYAGGAAEFLLTTQHPALRAAAPMYSPFDVYDEIGFPGGMRARWYLDRWAEINRRLDRNEAPVVRWHHRLAVRGVRPVDGNEGRVRLRKALFERGSNVDINEEASQVIFRDDVSSRIAGIDSMSPHAFAKLTRAAGVPVYSYSGWLDGAYQHGAIRRFLTLAHPHDKLIIGPWDHGGRHNVSPFAQTRASFDHHAELLKFFDFHLMGLATGVDREPRVHYYTMGAEVWRASEEWPPQATGELLFHLAHHGGLSEELDAETGSDHIEVDAKLGSGPMTRWTGLLGSTENAVLYPDWGQFGERALTYTSPVLSTALEVTGHPTMKLYVSADAEDASVFVVLEDVAPDGEVHYVTEGSLRALHRDSVGSSPPYRDPVPVLLYNRAGAAPLGPEKVAVLHFDLLPTSYQFPAGHRMRLSIATVDADYFDPIDGLTELSLHRGGEHASSLRLPIGAGSPTKVGAVPTPWQPTRRRRF